MHAECAWPWHAARHVAAAADARHARCSTAVWPSMSLRCPADVRVLVSDGRQACEPLAGHVRT
eukprot:3057010-Prymnesium_polylepis.1